MPRFAPAPRRLAPIAPLAAALVLLPSLAPACTNFLVTKGASADGSTFISYTADSHELYGELYHKPGGKHAPGTKIDVIEWDTGKRLGEIDQVAETYTRVGNINEHQVAVGETTWGGRPELADPDAVVDYGSLMYLALERAKTAREAIEVMTGLVAKYGYASSGESFSVSDPNEAWILEMIGKGKGNKGAVWVARRIPDGYVSGHANAARIRTFPRNDPKNTLYSADVVSFARSKGWFDGKDEDFSFADVYNPVDFGQRRFCDARVWCMYQRAAPTQKVGEDWAKGVPGAEELPLWIRPETKVGVSDVLRWMRDHFEGTALDMTADIGAGPYDLPYRWRPLTWKVDGKEYFNERAVATQQTGFYFVAQSRAWLPNPVGGVLWFGVDDTAASAVFPVYCGVTSVPKSWAQGTGSFHHVTWDAAFWVFNQVANMAYARWSEMIRDIRMVQQEMEGKFLGAQPEVDAAAAALYRQSPRLAKDYLTRYSVDAGEELAARWRELPKSLLLKYVDGNLKDSQGNVTHPGYPESWYRKIVAATGEKLLNRPFPEELKAEEEKKAKAKATGESILALLGARGLAVDDATREKISKSEKLPQLEGWLVRAATAKSAAEVVAE